RSGRRSTRPAAAESSRRFDGVRAARQRTSYFPEERTMARKYFGTDGIRGRVGEAPITPEFMLRLGHAAGRVLASRVPPVAAPGGKPGTWAAKSRAAGPRPAVLIGKDTRIS